MRKLYYVVLTLIHSRDANVIKIISLALGLMMSILLFSRVAFDLSVDTCFKDYQNLHQVWSVFTAKEEKMRPQQQNLGPLPGGIFQNFPDEVESAMHLALEVFMQFEAPDYDPLGIDTFKNDIVENPEYLKKAKTLLKIQLIMLITPHFSKL